MNLPKCIAPVFTEDAPKAIGPYSQGIVANGLLFVSGQIAIDPNTGEIVEGNIQDRTQRIMQNLAAVAKAAGTNLQNTVKTTIYLTNMDDFTAVNTVYGQYFSDSPPARATVCVQALPKGTDIEIDAIIRI